MDPQFEVVGEEASGRVDYAIKKIIDVVNEELIAITEGKQKDLVAGFMQNIMQLESSHHTNTRKRKASVAFDDEFDYLYGIVTTGRAFQSLCDFLSRCETKSSLCPSCGANHKENIVGEYRTGSYHLLHV